MNISKKILKKIEKILKIHENEISSHFINLMISDIKDIKKLNDSILDESDSKMIIFQFSISDDDFNLLSEKDSFLFQIIKIDKSFQSESRFQIFGNLRLIIHLISNYESFEIIRFIHN